MKVLILYKSKWGSTRDYAYKIHESLLSSDVYRLDKFDTTKLDEYDYVIIGSRTYMGKIEASKFVQDHWDTLQRKPLYLFSVGMLPPETKESEQSYLQIPSFIRSKIHYVKFPGRIDKSKLNLGEKMILKLRKGMDEDKVELSQVNKIIDHVNEYNK